jgi:Outer membrane efflux protein
MGTRFPISCGILMRYPRPISGRTIKSYSGCYGRLERWVHHAFHKSDRPESNLEIPGFEFLDSTPLSNPVNQKDLQAALNSELQPKQSLAAVELKATTDVRSAYERYTLASDAVVHYSSQLLQDADRVLEAKLYGYSRGSASLLDALEARRPNNDIYLAYYAALNERAKALIAFEQSAGIWDIDF